MLFEPLCVNVSEKATLYESHRISMFWAKSITMISGYMMRGDRYRPVVYGTPIPKE